MSDNEKIVLKFVENNIFEFAIELGYSYLDEGIGRWKDNYGTIHELSSMDRDYLKNCYNMVKRGIEEIDSGEIDSDMKVLFKTIVKNIDVDKELKYKRLKLSDDMCTKIKKELREVIVDKKGELEHYL